MIKNLILMVMVVGLFFAACGKTSETPSESAAADNPFFAEYDTPFQVPPFDIIKPEHFIPAYEKGMEEQKAAIEVLIYGLLFVWSKRNLEALEYDPSVQPVLSAERVHLKVLAPRTFYRGYQLSEFGNSLDNCLGLFSSESDLDMDFYFLELSETPNPYVDESMVRQTVRSAQLAMIQ